MFDNKLAFRTIGVIRSAISAYHHHIEGNPVGEHPLIKRMMTGVRNCRPPTPKYCVIWDVQKVLDWINALDHNSKLPLRILSWKTAILLALTTASRGCELSYLDIDLMSSSDSMLRFFFKDWLKQDRSSKKKVKHIDILKFENNEKLCPLTTTLTYIDRTQSIRGPTRKLFISHIAPHQAVVKSTIASWVKQTLAKTGVDVSKFKGHSTRAACTSKAAVRGASLSDIMDRGNWSDASTWQRFYNKTIDSPADRFQKAVLG